MKFIIVGIVWSYVFIYASVLLTIKLWNFNYLSVSDWGIIDTYWEQGGAIRQPKDYVFFLYLACSDSGLASGLALPVQKKLHRISDGSDCLV